MNMITLAARAILKQRFYIGDEEHYPDLETFYATCGSETIEEAEAEARAVIEAMREPTKAMQAAVAADWGHRTWRQYGEVIDAALTSQRD